MTPPHIPPAIYVGCAQVPEACKSTVDAPARVFREEQATLVVPLQLMVGIVWFASRIS